MKKFIVLTAMTAALALLATGCDEKKNSQNSAQEELAKITLTQKQQQIEYEIQNLKKGIIAQEIQNKKMGKIVYSTEHHRTYLKDLLKNDPKRLEAILKEIDESTKLQTK